MFRVFAKNLLQVADGITARNLTSLTLPQEYLQVQELCKNFANKELKPVAQHLDKEQTFPKEQIRKMGDLGLLSLCVPDKWGGLGLDMFALAVAIEEIARACAGTGAIMSIHNSLYVNLLNRCGTQKQKEEYLRPFTKGTIGCFALSEPDAGSDASNLATTATLDNDHYLLNGIKSWVTSGAEGQAAIIFATIDRTLGHKGITAFLVPLKSEGLTLGKKEDKLGIRASSTCAIMLDNVRVPKQNVLGKVGEGFKIAMEQLDEGRIGIAAQALGIGQAALDVAVKYSAERKAFGKPINQMQAVKLRIADMVMKLESARLLVWRAALLRKQLVKSTKETSMAKLAASEAAVFITHSAIQILGGMGYIKDVPAERHYRDAKITEIYGGVTDIQKLLIGDAIIKEYGF